MSLTRRVRPVDVTDHPEHRSIPMDRMEVREDSDDNVLVLEGYASTFEQYEMYGGPANGYGWIEQLDRRAFEKTLREKPDLHLLVNHAGTPLARTKSGTLDLSVDDKGLKVVARLDKRDPDVQSLAVKMERGDMDEMSFAFRVKAQKWEATDEFPEDDQALRTITEVSLHKGDVSVVNFGANPTTSVGLRSLPEALRFLAEADEEELAEVRSDEDLVKRAIEKLGGKGQVTIQNLYVGDGKAEEAREAEGIPGATGTILDGEINVVKEEREEESADVLGLVGQLTPALAEAITELVRNLVGAEAEESEERDETEETEEEAREEDVEETESEEGISLREALAEMGVDPEADELTVAEVEALLGNE
ncbi:capsid maturation protease [Mycobacterium phage Squint]|nr:capsid maturation protease [Mycobacterium phage Squint]